MSIDITATASAAARSGVWDTIGSQTQLGLVAGRSPPTPFHNIILAVLTYFLGWYLRSPQLGAVYSVFNEAETYYPQQQWRRMRRMVVD
jgi:hypothetical protein